MKGDEKIDDNEKIYSLPFVSNSDDSVSTPESEDEGRASAEAGVIRAMIRSLRTMGRQSIKLPGVGSLPAKAVPRKPPQLLRASRVSRTTLPKASQVPVQQVAKLSDRVSTGWDLWDSAQSARDYPRSRLTAMAMAFVKNTVLGAAVFETYSYSIEHLIPGMQLIPIADNDSAFTITDRSFDAYARATVVHHTISGGLGGAVHGVVGTIWESMAGEQRLRQLPQLTLHHSLAHATLFGSYEACKRVGLHLAELDSASLHGPAYLASVSVAGGIAGQIQHIISHYSEQILKLEETAVSNIVIQNLRPPTWRSVWMAFPSSSIGFVAFEYGKSLTTS